MDYILHELQAKDYIKVKDYFERRDPGICDSMFLDNYMWKNYYNTKFFLTDKGMFLVMNMRDTYFSLLPMCYKEDLKECFNDLVEYFNKELGKKLVIYIADEDGMEILDLDEDKFKVELTREYYDYVYDAESLRTLKGKKLHKKKNHVNYFVKTYENRYEYRTVTCANKDEILAFLDKWYNNKESDDIYKRLEQEYIGIVNVLEHCRELDFKMGAVYIDGVMQAFTLGSYSKTNDMAFIHVEKANPDIRGLYNFINQQFLLKEYPNVKLVNREDDMGIEGLRAAKLSYRPLYLAKKYAIFQK